MDHCFKYLGLTETDFFGLRFTDSKNEKVNQGEEEMTLMILETPVISLNVINHDSHVFCVPIFYSLFPSLVFLC